jgi:hypothetical protein
MIVQSTKYEVQSRDTGLYKVPSTKYNVEVRDTKYGINLISNTERRLKNFEVKRLGALYLVHCTWYFVQISNSYNYSKSATRIPLRKVSNPNGVGE